MIVRGIRSPPLLVVAQSTPPTPDTDARVTPSTISSLHTLLERWAHRRDAGRYLLRPRVLRLRPGNAWKHFLVGRIRFSFICRGSIHNVRGQMSRTSKREPILTFLSRLPGIRIGCTPNGQSCHRETVETLVQFSRLRSHARRSHRSVQCTVLHECVRGSTTARNDARGSNSSAVVAEIVAPDGTQHGTQRSHGFLARVRSWRRG